MANVKEPPLPGDEFWESRPNLKKIHGIAIASRVNPWALLGCCMAHAVADTDPHVKLPAIIGSPASINLFIAIVGDSGDGKGNAQKVAEQIMPSCVETYGIGSGEGLAHIFRKRVGGELVTVTDRALLDVPEVDTLRGLVDRKGATIMPEMRKAWMGEKLGFQYADANKRLPVDAHSYRICALVGVQPKRADVLLNDVDGGTPQRFLWFPAHNPDAPDERPRTKERGKLSLKNLPEFRNEMNLDADLIIDVDESIWDEVDADYLKRHRGEGNSSDGHRMLAREKVAAAIALLTSDTPHTITREDWELAGMVMQVSDITKGKITESTSAASKAQNQARGYMEADREIIKQQKTHEHQVKRVADGMVRSASKGPKTKNDLRKSVRSTDRHLAEEAYSYAIENKMMVVRGDGKHEVA